MTAQIRNLHVLSYAAGFTAWVYRGATPIAAIDSDGFFNQMCDMLALGDTIACVCTDGTALRYVVSARNAAVVVAPMR